MDTQQLVSYVFLAVGLIDFIVIPRVLLHVWNKRGQAPANQSLIVNALRLSGLAMIIVGALFHYRVFEL